MPSPENEELTQEANNPTPETERPQEQTPEMPNNDLIAKMDEKTLELNRQRFMARHGFGPAPAEDSEQPSETPGQDIKPDATVDEHPEESGRSEEDGKEDVTEGEEKEGKDTEKKVNKAAPEAEEKESHFDSDDVAEVAAKAASEAASRVAEQYNRRETEKAEKKPESKLTDRQKRTLAILGEIEQNDPKYQGAPLTKQIQALWSKEDAYIAQWKAENPGKTYDERADEHVDFYADNTPEYSQDAYEEARDRIVERQIKETEDRVEQRVRELEYENRVHRETPRIAQATHHQLATLAAEVDPEIAKIVLPEGKPNLNAETVAKMKEVNPVAHRLLSVESARLEAVVKEFETMEAFPGHVRFDADKSVTLPNGETFYLHREIDQFGAALEDALSQSPKSGLRKDGKEWLRRDKYLEEKRKIEATSKTKSEAAKRIKEELDGKHWIVNGEFFHSAYRGMLSKKVKEQVSEWRQLFPGGPRPASEQPQSKQAGAPNFKPKTEKTAPPSMSSASDRTKGVDPQDRNTVDRDAAIEQRMGWK